MKPITIERDKPAQIKCKPGASAQPETDSADSASRHAYAPDTLHFSPVAGFPCCFRAKTDRCNHAFIKTHQFTATSLARLLQMGRDLDRNYMRPLSVESRQKWRSADFGGFHRILNCSNPAVYLGEINLICGVYLRNRWNASAHVFPPELRDLVGETKATSWKRYFSVIESNLIFCLKNPWKTVYFKCI